MSDKHKQAEILGNSAMRPSRAYGMMGGDSAAESIVAEIEKAGNEDLKAKWLISPISFEKADNLLKLTENKLPHIKKHTEEFSGMAGTYAALSIWELLHRHNGTWPEKK